MDGAQHDPGDHGVISFQLALFNLLPIPILDGGLMLMLVIESIIRRDIKQEIKERAYQAALVFLLLFAFVVIAASAFPVWARARCQPRSAAWSSRASCFGTRT